MTETEQTPKSTRVTLTASRWDDCDGGDMLAAAQKEAQDTLDLAGWDLCPRWGDSERETIVLSVPAHVDPQPLYDGE